MYTQESAGLIANVVVSHSIFSYYRIYYCIPYMIHKNDFEIYKITPAVYEIFIMLMLTLIVDNIRTNI